jgi:hypothetical protein
VPKLRDIVGPPAHAVVLSVDEKSQIQALHRTQPGLPLKKGRAGTMTHHGTTTLFAALNVLDGTVIGRCMQRHRHQEFICFLNAMEAAVPAGKIVHVIPDKYAAHKQPKVLAWLARHPRFVFHFTPTSCSSLNAVETFFATLTKRRLKRGVFRSVVDLQASINRYLDEATMTQALHDAAPLERSQIGHRVRLAPVSAFRCGTLLRASLSLNRQMRYARETAMHDQLYAGWL